MVEPPKKLKNSVFNFIGVPCYIDAVQRAVFSPHEIKVDKICKVDKLSYLTGSQTERPRPHATNEGEGDIT